MERRMRNIKVSVIIARGLAQWMSQALIETKIGQIHQLHSMYIQKDVLDLCPRYFDDVLQVL